MFWTVYMSVAPNTHVTVVGFVDYGGQLASLGLVHRFADHLFKAVEVQWRTSVLQNPARYGATLRDQCQTLSLHFNCFFCFLQKNTHTCKNENDVMALLANFHFLLFRVL